MSIIWIGSYQWNFLDDVAVLLIFWVVLILFPIETEVVYSPINSQGFLFSMACHIFPAFLNAEFINNFGLHFPNSKWYWTFFHISIIMIPYVCFENMFFSASITIFDRALLLLLSFMTFSFILDTNPFSHSDLFFTAYHY